MDQSLDFAIVVALKEEFSQFWQSIEVKYDVELDAQTDCIYYKFELMGLAGVRRCVALMIGEMGPTRAAVAVARLIEQYSPRVVVNIGIAASLDDDIRLGDVVAATAVDAYLNSGKVTDLGPEEAPAIQFAGEVFTCSPRLVARVRNMEFTNPVSYHQWRSDCARGDGSPESGGTEARDQLADQRLPNLFEGPIASGPLVISSQSFRGLLAARNRKYSALEMEAAGLATTFERLDRRPELLVLKAISDYGTTTKAELDAFGGGAYRRAAMRNVTLLLTTLIKQDILEWEGAFLGGGRARSLRHDRWSDGFVGRSSELADLTQKFADPAGPRLVSIVGEGGIGKTRLAAEFASRNSALFPDGIFAVDLGSTFELDGMLSAIERALGLEAGQESSRIERLAFALRNAELLLVLDNFETVVDRAPLIQDILDATERPRMLATSREPLKIRSERLVRLNPMPFPGVHDDPLTFAQFDAVLLFMTRVKETAPEGDTSRSLAPVAEICRQLDGMPLGIELLARQSAYLDPKDILTALQRREEASSLLTDRSRSSSDRHRSLFSAFESSIASLSDEQSQLLLELSVFSGGAAAESLRAVHGEQEPGFVRALQSLIDKSLVRVERSGARDARYTMLTPIRDYVCARWAGLEQVARAKQSHARYFAALAVQAEAELVGPAQTDWLDRIETDVWNFAEAQRWLAENDQLASAMELVASLGRFWFTRDFLTLGRDLSAAPEELLPGIPPRTVANWRVLRALLAWYGGDYRAADSLFADVVKFGADNKVAWFEANGLANRGLIAQSENRLADALALYAAGESVARAAGDIWNLAICRIGTARALHDQPDLPQAEAIYLEALALFRRVGDLWSIGRTLRRILILGVDTDNEALIRDNLPEARLVCEKLGDVYGSAQLDSILATREEKNSHVPEALGLYLSSALVFSRLGVRDELDPVLDRCVTLLLRRYEVRLAGLLSGLAQQVRGNSAAASSSEYLSTLTAPDLSTNDRRVFENEFVRGLVADSRVVLMEAMAVAVVPANRSDSA